MKVVIVTGGDVEPSSAAGFLRTYGEAYVVAVDGGLSQTEKLGLMPDCIVGDFDTVSGPLLDDYRKRGIPFETHRPEKDYTDTELALLYSLSLPGVTEIVILGGLGRRFDHALANVQVLLHPLKKGVPCRIVDAYNRISLADHPLELERSKVWGRYISLIPFTEQVKGVTLTGFKYPLKEATLIQGASIGISNELISEQGKIFFREGILVYIESKD
ncbi:MAG: thiamine diphosphokinase [Lachnospiraceae bacterium]|jgi:thiamine pyrophosphokinase|nr:thiamine diphosphokinase [Lachnospiraceae bacterium]